LGFKDGLHNPHVEGSGVDALPGYNATVKAGEFIMGYPDENGQTATNPEPELLRRNGTYVAFRKFHIRVAAFRKYLREQTSSPEEEELILRWSADGAVVPPWCSLLSMTIPR
jgi:deferrochelatase/peroxidase EfeB